MREFIPDYLGRASVITRDFTRERGRQERHSQRTMMTEEVGVMCIEDDGRTTAQGNIRKTGSQIHMIQ